MASEEAWIHPVYKERVVLGKADDTFLGELFASRGRANGQRALRNKAFEAWNGAGRPAPGNRPRGGTAIGTLRLPWGDQIWPRYELGCWLRAVTEPGAPAATAERPRRPRFLRRGPEDGVAQREPPRTTETGRRE